MDAHSHILNDPELTSLLSSQVYFEYFEELELGLKKLSIRVGSLIKGIACKKRPK